jgi:hypothetical protein
MADLAWFEEYSGQTVEQLLSLEGEYRTDSLVVAFEQAIGQKAARVGDENLTAEERSVLAVEALEREVNNGGYSQFFQNAPEFMPLIVESLLCIGCPKTAAITKSAIDAFGLIRDSEEQSGELNQCDDAYFNAQEDIAGQLFAFIRAKKNEIKL